MFEPSAHLLSSANTETTTTHNHISLPAEFPDCYIHTAVVDQQPSWQTCEHANMRSPVANSMQNCNIFINVLASKSTLFVSGQSP